MNLFPPMELNAVRGQVSGRGQRRLSTCPEVCEGNCHVPLLVPVTDCNSALARPNDPGPLVLPQEHEARVRESLPPCPRSSSRLEGQTQGAPQASWARFG